ncbi:MAG: 23S rRNA (uracil(1939)-C(5))-methyltransferase RlmD [Ignavibacteriae bacterium]|nr:MAG: 23S rRNA (uracil(1939)-C(5))-methyltransferase RlmD [Ignavibacteriota bacterium]
MPQKDEILELTVTDLSFEGKGVARTSSDFVVFVNNVIPGDVIKAQVRKVKKNYAEAKLTEIITASALRAVPLCEYFGTCNGCKMQNLEYAHQLEFKRKIVHNAFERIGGFENINVPATIGSDEIYYYRNKLEFSFSNSRWLTNEDKDNEKADRSFALGFHIPKFIDKVIDIRRCYLQSELSNKILNLTRDFFKSRKLSIYSTHTHSGYLRYLIIRQSPVTGEIMVNLITSEEKQNLINEFSKELQEAVPEVTTFINTISTSKAQVASGEKSFEIFGEGYITEQVGKYKFVISPLSFFQTNTLQAKKLFDTVLEFGKFTGKENVLDLYCGCGAISLYISEHVNKVMGVELSNESILSAHENAELNNVTNCDFVSYDVKDYLGIIKSEKSVRYDTFVIDPPRSGIHPKAAEYILEYEPDKIIYVSCNPTTQARDVKLLAEKYDITAIQPVDMFPHTYHVENVVKLEKKVL